MHCQKSNPCALRFPSGGVVKNAPAGLRDPRVQARPGRAKERRLQSSRIPNCCVRWEVRPSWIEFAPPHLTMRGTSHSVERAGVEPAPACRPRDPVPVFDRLAVRSLPSRLADWWSASVPVCVSAKWAVSRVTVHAAAPTNPAGGSYAKSSGEKVSGRPGSAQRGPRDAD